MNVESNIVDQDLESLARTFKLKGSRRSRYNDEFKRKVVYKVLIEGFAVLPLSKSIGVPRQLIYRWISNFSDSKSSIKTTRISKEVNQDSNLMPQKKVNPVETPDQELVRLREENKKLQEALKMAEWSNHAKDVMIDIAEKTFNIPIRKNLVPNSKRACRREGKGSDHGPSLSAVWQELAGLLSA